MACPSYLACASSVWSAPAMLAPWAYSHAVSPRVGKHGFPKPKREPGSRTPKKVRAREGGAYAATTTARYPRAGCLADASRCRGQHAGPAAGRGATPAAAVAPLCRVLPPVTGLAPAGAAGPATAVEAIPGRHSPAAGLGAGTNPGSHPQCQWGMYPARCYHGGEH